jgi:FkbH-like protein
VNLLDALELLKKPLPEGAVSRRTGLACSFTPLHLQTFLAAHLRQRMPGQRIEIETGLFGDLAGNIERLSQLPQDALAIFIEWQDLDPRLGIRSLGGWKVTDVADIVESAKSSAARLDRVIGQAATAVPICICMPTLPLPPLFPNPAPEAASTELQLRQLTASLAASLSTISHIRMLQSQSLDEFSPLSARHDAQSELMTGFPYKLPHASTVAELIATLIQNPVPKKGLITDLDDTLWAGILGEVGPQNISWSLDNHTHIYGLYQQFLASLASSGVLIGAASKNDATLVEEALQRKDLLLARESIYPVAAHWGRKSESVHRILKTWNISSEDVVFIDDSPMEVAEVNDAFPTMECIVFPKDDDQAVLNLLKRLRTIFGKRHVTPEDSIRSKSIRAAEASRESSMLSGGTLDDFLRNANAHIRLDFGNSNDERAFELINKTNQFNLNGKRLTAVEWKDYLSDPAAFLMTVSYEDKYGPLGKIAALLGKVDQKTIRLDHWVMSCRAFSRRIEQQSLEQLFEKFDAEEIIFDYRATPRNGPLQEFFADLLSAPVAVTPRLSRNAFRERSFPLFQRVEEVTHG